MIPTAHRSATAKTFLHKKASEGLHRPQMASWMLAQEDKTGIQWLKVAVITFRAQSS